MKPDSRDFEDIREYDAACDRWQEHREEGMMPEPNDVLILTSYLNHPALKEPISGVLRVLVARKALGFQKGRFDAQLRSAAPSEEAMNAGKEGDFSLYEAELLQNDQAVISEFIRLMEQHPLTRTLILLCHEADATTCHRRLTFQTLAGRPWLPGDELESKHGGKGRARGVETSQQCPLRNNPAAGTPAVI